MSIIEIVLIGIGLAADAFAVAVCKGMNIKKTTIKEMLIVGLYFGIFQAVMPLIGYYIGTLFGNYIMQFDHWVAFALLAIVGGKMIYEAVKEMREPDIQSEREKKEAPSLSIKVMLVLALATSVDALAVGVTFSFIKVNIFIAMAIIGGITLILSAVGVKLGTIVGNKLRHKAEIAGGAILLLIGIKILIEHLFF